MSDHTHVRPWRHIERRKSRQIRVGSVLVGGDAPISVQSMTNTPTTDAAATLEQIRQLLELYDPAERNVTQTRATLVTARERLADMERQHRDLAGAIEELRQQIAQGETWLANLKSGA